MNKFIKYILVILLSILATLYSKNDLNVLLSIPLLVFFMFNGIKSFLFSLLGLLLGSLFNYLTFKSYIPFTYLLIGLTIFFISYHLQLIFNKKLILNYVSSIMLSIIGSYLILMLSTNSFDIKSFIIILFLTIIVSFIFAYLLKGFSYHLLSFNNKESKILLYSLIIIYFSFLSSIIENEYISLTIILLVLLMFSLKESIIYVLSINALLIVLSYLLSINILINNIYIYLPVSILLSINKSKKNLLNSIMLLASFIIIYFLFNINDYVFYFIMSLFISISFLFINFYNVNKDEEKYYLQYIDNKNKMLKQLNNFKNMFITLSNNFSSSNKEKMLYKLKINVFDKFCSNCNKYKDCIKKGKHLLLNYTNEKINNSVDESKTLYIKQNCLKQESYFKLLDNFINSYLIKTFENELEYKTNTILANDFNSFSNVMQQSYNSFLNDRLIIKNNFFSNISIVLKKHNFDVLFINDLSHDNSYYYDIAIKNIDKENIYSLFLPLIEEVLQTSIKIIKIDKATLSSNYFIISIQEKEKLNVSFSIKQSNEDIFANGDSYSTLIDDNIFYMALSDGMGHGILANDVSKFTLKTLFSMLNAKIEIQESIKLTNNIVQLKNNFDIYSTLDLLAIDLSNNIASFFKFGAINGFIIRDNIVTVINNYSLPLGIIDNIDTKPSSFVIKKDDIIVLCSDGMIDDDISLVIPILENLKDDDIHTMCNTLFSQLINIRKNIDDATLALIKIK